MRWSVGAGPVRSVIPRQRAARRLSDGTLDGGLITPGFVDLQVNGGGGVMFNDDQSVETLRTIAEAHATTGTHALLATLITDTPERTRAAISAVEAAIAAKGRRHRRASILKVRICRSRAKGAHDPTLDPPDDR